MAGDVNTIPADLDENGEYITLESSVAELFGDGNVSRRPKILSRRRKTACFKVDLERDPCFEFLHSLARPGYAAEHPYEDRPSDRAASFSYRQAQHRTDRDRRDQADRRQLSDDAALSAEQRPDLLFG